MFEGKERKRRRCERRRDLKKKYFCVCFVVDFFDFFLVLTNTSKSRGEESDCLKEKREKEKRM